MNAFDAFVDELAARFIQRLTDALPAAEVHRHLARKPRQAKPKRGPKPGPLSAEKMQCRHEADGVRCTARSRGPRYGFRCKEHAL